MVTQVAMQERRTERAHIKQPQNGNTLPSRARSGTNSSRSLSVHQVHSLGWRGGGAACVKHATFHMSYTHACDGPRSFAGETNHVRFHQERGDGGPGC